MATKDSTNVPVNICPESQERKRKKKDVEFTGQVNCTCTRKCSENIDILRQKELHQQFYSLRNWAAKTHFIREIIAQTKTEKENLNPVLQLKKRKFHCKCFLTDDAGKKHPVCLSFVSKLLKLNRSKLFRAVDSKKFNPSGVENNF